MMWVRETSNQIVWIILLANLMQSCELLGESGLFIPPLSRNLGQVMRSYIRSWFLDILQVCDQPNACLKSDPNESNQDRAGQFHCLCSVTCPNDNTPQLVRNKRSDLEHIDRWFLATRLHVALSNLEVLYMGGLFQPQTLEINKWNWKKALQNMIPTEMQV